ncbi:hypothetical protein BJX61DRAFT_213873 [Aspergillus egyptiacus]|nr:hypothetical protein BJX61DRAFT_213873 [Aspergillus egyptiacus]
MANANPNYPDPPYNDREVGKRLNLDSLADPPEDYRFLGLSSLTGRSTSRRPRKADVNRWCDHYLWGFDVDFGRRRVVRSMEQAIQKLMYYTAEEHRPWDFAEFNACTRDAGPRLIDYTKVPWDRPHELLDRQGLLYAPVSRFYPTRPRPDETVPPGFAPPAGAPRHWPVAWVQQAHLPSTRDPNSNASPTLGELVLSTVQLAAVVSDADTRARVQDAVQRVVMKFAYSDLERHSTAVPHEPVRGYTATCASNLFQATIVSRLAVSHVRLYEDDRGRLYPDRGGHLWKVKGRGPTYSEKSAAIDCVVTVGKLLDAWSTHVDRRDRHWFTHLNGLQRTFIELTDVNWDLCTADSGAQMKGKFQSLIQQTVDNFGDDNPESVGSLWGAVAGGLGQCALTYDETIIHCRCSRAPDISRSRTTGVIELPVCDSLADSRGVRMDELFKRVLQPEQVPTCSDCGAANGVRKKRAIRQLPLRLAVRPHRQVSVLKHTRDIRFTYRPSGHAGSDLSVTYRWLGGIYHDGRGYRVFWNDTEPGEIDNKHVRMYESTNEGLIVCGQATPQPEDRVPSRWWKNKPIPLLFYERILNPPQGVLAEALRTVNQMCMDETEGTLTLQKGQIPSAPAPNCSKPYPSGYPWQTLEVAKPLAAYHYHAAPRMFVSSLNQIASMTTPRPGHGPSGGPSPGSNQIPDNGSTSRTTDIIGPAGTSDSANVRRISNLEGLPDLGDLSGSSARGFLSNPLPGASQSTPSEVTAPSGTSADSSGKTDECGATATDGKSTSPEYSVEGPKRKISEDTNYSIDSETSDRPTKKVNLGLGPGVGERRGKRGRDSS